MFLHRKPSEEVIRQFISSQQDLPFSYEQVGTTESQARDGHKGYTVDHNRIKLGEGKETYERAMSALLSSLPGQHDWTLFRGANALEETANRLVLICRDRSRALGQRPGVNQLIPFYFVRCFIRTKRYF